MEISQNQAASRVRPTTEGKSHALFALAVRQTTTRGGKTFNGSGGVSKAAGILGCLGYAAYGKSPGQILQKS